MSAASYMSWGMFCNPARKISMRLPPAVPHTAMKISVGLTRSKSASHPCGDSPASRSP